MENSPYQGQGMSLNAHNRPDVKPYTRSQMGALYKEIDNNQRRDKEVIQKYAERRQKIMDKRLGEFAQKVIQTPFKELERRQENGKAPTKVLPLEANRKVNIPLDEIQDGIFIGQRLNNRKLSANESDTIRGASLALDVKNSKDGALTNAEGCGLYIEPSSDRSRFDITNPIGNKDMVIWVGENREKVVIRADGKVKQIDMRNKSGILFVMGGENGSKEIRVKNHLKKGSITVQSRHLSNKYLKEPQAIDKPKHPKNQTQLKDEAGKTPERKISDGNYGHLLDGPPQNPWELLYKNGFTTDTPVIYGGSPNAPRQKERFAVAITDNQGIPIHDGQTNLKYPPEIAQFKIVNGKLEYTCIGEKHIIPITHRRLSKMDILNAPLVKGQTGQIESNSQGEFIYEENGNKLRFIIRTGNITSTPPEIGIDVKSI